MGIKRASFLPTSSLNSRNLMTSPANATGLPQPQFPDGVMELSSMDFIVWMESNPECKSFILPPDIEGYCFRMEHWARNAPKEIEDV